MMQFLTDPVIIVMFVISIIGALVWWRWRNAGETDRLDERTTIFVFPRNGGYEEIKARTFDGLVVYETGGMIERSDCVVPLFYGRAGFLEAKNPNAARDRVNVFLTRPGDAAPMNLHRDDMKPEEIGKETFEAYSAISVEREVNRGKLDAAKSLLSERLIAIGAFVAILMAVFTWILVLILPLTPLPVKSATTVQPTPTQGTPTLPDSVFPTPFVPTNYR